MDESDLNKLRKFGWGRFAHEIERLREENRWMRQTIENCHRENGRKCMCFLPEEKGAPEPKWHKKVQE